MVYRSIRSICFAVALAVGIGAWSSSARSQPGAAPTAKPIVVVTTLTVYQAMARAIGGDNVIVEALARPNEDPHRIDARPSLAGRVRDADVFVETGMSLESSWTTHVLRLAGKADLRAGGRGHVYASAGISALEIPAEVSRAHGDVHPEGNPHVWLDPLNAKRIAQNITAGLIRVDPARTGDYERGLREFHRRIDVASYGEWLVENFGSAVLDRLAASGRLIGFLRDRDYRGEPLIDKLGGWHRFALPLHGRKIVTYHRNWTYFAARFGFSVPATIEPLPGLPPTASHRESLVQQMKSESIRTIFVATLYDTNYAERIAAQADATVAVLPLTCGAVEGTADYFALIDTILRRAVAAVPGD